jgi:hypothetical protein
MMQLSSSFFQLVSTRMTEGQHLMSVMQDVFSKAIDTTPADQQDTLRDDMSYLRNSWEQLNIDLNSVMAQLKVHIFQQIIYILDALLCFIFIGSYIFNLQNSAVASSLSSCLVFHEFCTKCLVLVVLACYPTAVSY